RPTRRPGRAGPLWLLRGAGLHKHAPARGERRRNYPRFPGAPSGHDGGRHRQRSPRREDAGTVSCRANRAGDGTSVAGTHAARCRGSSSQGGGSRDGSDGPRPGAPCGAAAPLRARRHGTITTTVDVVVSPEDNAEVRRVSVANAGPRTRDIELTSYAELVLAPPAADTTHPVFSKLFVQTEYLAKIGTILATRRRRSPAEPEIWAAHLAVV